MSNHNDVLVVQHLRCYSVEPVREHSINSDFETFSSWDRIIRQRLVLVGEPWMTFIVDIKRWWWNVVAPSPLENLLLSVLGSGLSLIESLQCTVVSFVQSPVLVVRNPVQVQLIGNGVISLDGSLKHGGVRDVKLETFLLEHLTSLNGFLDASFRQGHIVPPGEPVFLVPSRLTVTYKDHLVDFAPPAHLILIIN